MIALRIRSVCSFFGHFEAAMNARDDKIKVAQHPVGIVERAVPKNISFDAFQDAKGLPVTFIQPIGLAVLLSDFLKREIRRRSEPIANDPRRRNTRNRACAWRSAIVSSVSVPSDAVVWQ